MEAAALKVGAQVASQGARFWLGRRRKVTERESSLADLVAAEVAGPLDRVKAASLVERIGYGVAEQLAPLVEQRFGTLPPNEVEAATLAVIDVLDDVDLSDDGLLAADADAEALAKQVRAQFPDHARAAGLSEAARPLYELALDQACRYLVQVLRHLPTFQPRALSAVLGRLSTVTEQLDLVLGRIPTTSLYAPRGTDLDADFEAEYLRVLATTLDRLELLGLPGDEQPTLALTVAYLSLSVSDEFGRPRRRRRDSTPLRFDHLGGVPDQTDGIPVESAIGKHDRVLLRGDAGSGKTTLLSWLAVRAARRELGGALAEWNGRVPFLIRLRSHATGRLPGPEDFARDAAPGLAAVMPEGWAHRLLLSGRAVLLVDGVDEVLPSRRRAVKNWLRDDVLAAYPRARVVITARTAAADRRWLAAEGFTTVTLESMSPANVIAFTDRWHRAAEATGTHLDITAAECRLRTQLERSHLRELAATPLLCAMLCALNLAHRAELPRNRMDLYAKALSMLLHFRDAERGIAGLLSDTEKRVLLRDLAWRLTLANRIEFTTERALEHLSTKVRAMPNVSEAPAALLEHLVERSGVLRSPAPGQVDFVHRTFQEYLAADEAIQQHHVDTLIGNAHLDTWWDTVIMACGHATAKQADDLVTGILDHAEAEAEHSRHLRLLAAACLETIQDIASETRDRVDTMIRRTLVPPKDLRETKSLAAIGHRLLGYLPRSLDEFPEATAAAVVRAAALTGAKEALPRLAGYAGDPRYQVQQEVTAAWKFFDPAAYADEVLAEAPLFDGWISVTYRRHLPHLHRLRKLTSVDVRLDLNQGLESLHDLQDVRLLNRLWLRLPARATCDLELLTGHTGLESLLIWGKAEVVGVRALAELAGIEDIGVAGWPAPLSAFGCLPRLQTLRLLGRQRYDLALEPLPGVVQLMINRNLAGWMDLDLRAHFPDLRHLSLVGLRAPALDRLAAVDLVSLNLHGCRDIALAPLREHPTLESLGLTGLKTVVDLTALAGLDWEFLLDRQGEFKGREGLGPRVRLSTAYY
ncbi:NACHT domain-containing protein [Actinokineospora auranticolor]|uniref:NACHT domain-containing protein n=1 Tax=Actinokineospora auranticolor TaxID=155976 RepID=UPI003CCC10D3